MEALRNAARPSARRTENTCVGEALRHKIRSVKLTSYPRSNLLSVGCASPPVPLRVPPRSERA